MTDVCLQSSILWVITNTFFLCVHANAGGGSGVEIYTTPGDTESDKIATIFGEAFKNEFPTETLRTDFSDGDLDKEQRFYVLSKTKMPSILTENFFMDNVKDFQAILNTIEGRQRIINYHVKAIITVKNNLYKT